MDFPTYLVQVRNFKKKSASSYQSRVQKVLKDFNIVSHTPSIQEITQLINAIDNNSKYRRGIHGNPYVPPLKAYKEYLSKHYPTQTTKGITNPSLPYLPYGDDKDREHVRYEDNIPTGEKVIGLTEFLEGEYRRIREFLCFLFQVKNLPHDIEIILSDKKPIDHYSTSKKSIEKILLQRLEKGQLTKADIQDVFQKSEIDLRRGGDYYHDKERYIIHLYYQNIIAIDYDFYQLTMVNVLCHEMTHFVHNFLVGDKVFYNKKQKNNCIVEGVADFVAFFYLFHREKYFHSPYTMDITQSRYDFWVEYFDYDLPYAKALCFAGAYDNNENAYLNKGSLSKVLEIIEANKISIDIAYDILINKKIHP